MENRHNAIEAVAAVLRNSAAADGSLYDSDMREFAAIIVSVVEATEMRASIESAVTDNWELDTYQYNVEFGGAD